MKQAGATFFIYFVERDPIYGPNVLVGILLEPNTKLMECIPKRKFRLSNNHFQDHIPEKRPRKASLNMQFNAGRHIAKRQIQNVPNLHRQLQLCCGHERHKECGKRLRMDRNIRSIIVSSARYFPPFFK